MCHSEMPQSIDKYLCGIVEIPMENIFFVLYQIPENNKPKNEKISIIMHNDMGAIVVRIKGAGKASFSQKENT